MLTANGAVSNDETYRSAALQHPGVETELCQSVRRSGMEKATVKVGDDVLC